MIKMNLLRRRAWKTDMEHMLFLLYVELSVLVVVFALWIFVRG